MQLISVNIGQERTQQNGTRLETTGIYKFPVQLSAQVTSLGLKGDFVCDTKNHGGPDQAIYVYGAADNAWWSQELGREIVPGTFGENLTISELESAQFIIGDRLQIGSRYFASDLPALPVQHAGGAHGRPEICQTLSSGRTAGIILPRHPGRDRTGGG